MLKNYILTGLRFLRQNKIFAIINVTGLSIALAASFIILLYVINEFSYDRYNKKSKRIYRVLNYYEEFDNIMSGTPYILASALKNEFPQVENAVKMRFIRGFKLQLNNELINISDVIATDSDVFDIFTIPLIAGTPSSNLLDDIYSIVLSRDLAEKFFPGEDPVGKDIEGIVNDEEHVFTIKGVFENIPVNSTLKSQCFINSEWTVGPINKTFGIDNADLSWTQNFWITWVLLTEDANPKTLEDQFPAFEVKNISEKPVFHYSLQNLPDVYLGSAHVGNSGVSGNIKNVRLFSAIALLIIIVATINYIILSTAVSSARSKEIGIRKTFGAGNNNIRSQLLSESTLLVLIVLPLSLLLMWLAMPYAGKLFQTRLQIVNSNIVIYVSIYLTLTLVIGLLSGMYTSVYLSRLKVLNIFKNTTHSGNKKFIFRSSLIVLQLIIFCTFVSSTLIIHSQYNYAVKADPGYNTTNILVVNLGNNFPGYSAFLNNIKSSPDVILAAGAMYGLPMRGSMSFMYPNFQNSEINVKLEGLAVDYHFLETMGISVLKGRYFSEDFGSDLKNSIILNETAVKQLGITDPIGNMIGNQTIIGIVKDFHLHSVHTDLPPIAISMTDRYLNQIALHYKPGSLRTVIPMLESEWNKVAPDRTFNFSTIEDLTMNLYSAEKNLTTIVSVFALFTLLIAALGLYGLTLFFARSRTKEIGIKKVLGSSELTIVYSFLRVNLILLSIASLISIPVTLYFMTRWLNNFAYKVNINWWIFVTAFFIATVVVLLTVCIQSFKAARTNPVEALRYE